VNKKVKVTVAVSTVDPEHIEQIKDHLCHAGWGAEPARTLHGGATTFLDYEVEMEKQT
jgi:hypothetical protein